MLPALTTSNSSILTPLLFEVMVIVPPLTVTEPMSNCALLMAPLPLTADRVNFSVPVAPVIKLFAPSMLTFVDDVSENVARLPPPATRIVPPDATLIVPPPVAVLPLLDWNVNVLPAWIFNVFCVSSSRFAIVALISRFTVATPGFPLLISALKLPLGTPLFQFAALLQLPVASVHVLLVCAELPAARTPHSTAKHNAPPRRIDAIRSFKPSLFMISPPERHVRAHVALLRRVNPSNARTVAELLLQ